ncbi:MAG: ArsR family transcriptional regulator [Archaeoglobus sp.]|nr:ArsR family transcriptional regulator [Archaeoglobus sp.]
MTRERILQLLQERPRTLQELARILRMNEPSIKWHLVRDEIEGRVKIKNNLIFLDSSFYSYKTRNNPTTAECETGYGYVNRGSKPSLFDFYSDNECEVKTDNRPSLTKSSKFNGGSQKGEVPLSKTSHLARDHHDHNPTNGEVPLTWLSVIERIKSGKDRVTPQILGLISRSKGCIAHRIIAKHLKLDRTTITKRINSLVNLNILERIPSRPRKYIVDSRFLEMMNGDISHWIGTPIPAPENGYFRLHGFQRVFLMVNFHLDNVNLHFYRDLLLKRYGWRLAKVIKRRGWKSYIFTHPDFKELKIELTKRTIIVSPKFKESFIIPFDDFPENPEDLRRRITNYVRSAAEDFSKALSDVLTTNISIIDRGWAGENPVSPKAKKKEFKKINKPEVSYIDPDGIIHRTEERYGKFYINDLGWFIDKSLKTEAELEFRNDAESDSIEKSSKFKRMIEALSDPHILNGIKYLGQSEGFAVSASGGLPAQNLLESLKESIRNLESRLERIEKLILEGNGKYIRESTQVLNAVAITMERLTKLEEKLAKNGFPVFDPG